MEYLEPSLFKNPNWLDHALFYVTNALADTIYVAPCLWFIDSPIYDIA